MQTCTAYGQLHDKKEVFYDEVQVPPAEPKDDLYTTIPNVQTEDRYKTPPKRQHSQRKSQITDNRNLNEYEEPNKCIPSENPHVNMPIDIASSNTEKLPERQYTQRKSQIADIHNPNEYEEPNKCTPSENPLYMNIPTDISISHTEKLPERQNTQQKRKSQIADNPDSNEYVEPNKCTPPENPPYVNVPTSNTDNEDAYEELISFIKGKFSPNQMDAMVTMLQSVKDAEEGSQADDSGTVPLSIPQPDHSPPPDPMVDIDIYPDVSDYNTDDKDKKEPECYTDASTPPFFKDKPTSLCRDFKSKEGIRAFGMLLIIYGVLS